MRIREYRGPLGILVAGVVGVSLLCSVSAMAMSDLRNYIPATLVPLNIVDFAVSNLNTAVAFTEQSVTEFVPTATLLPTETATLTPTPTDTPRIFVTVTPRKTRPPRDPTAAPLRRTNTPRPADTDVPPTPVPPTATPEPPTPIPDTPTDPPPTVEPPTIEPPTNEPPTTEPPTIEPPPPPTLSIDNPAPTEGSPPP